MTAFKSLRRRSNKMRSRAIFAGILFLLGTIGLAVMAFMPLTIGVEVQWYGELTLMNFWQPFADLFANLELFLEQPTDMVIAVFCALLFILMVVFTVINALRAIAKMDGLCMRGSRRVGFNQNKIAVDKLANIFACSYGLVSIHTLVIMALNPSDDGVFSVLFMIATIVYLVVHLITGPIVGSISTFTVRDFIAEKPRTHGGFAPFLRNVLQFAAIGGVVFFALQLKDLPINLFPDLANSLCNMPRTIQDFASGDLEVIFHRVCELVWGIGFVAFLCLFRHAINFTEFVSYGEKAKGRKSARTASFMVFLSIFLLWAHPIVLHVIVDGVFPEWNSILDYSYGKLELLYAAGVMLALFIIECMLAKFPKMKKKYQGTTGEVALVYDLPDADGEMMAQAAMSAPIMMTPATNGKDPVMVMVNQNGQPIMMVPSPMMQPVMMVPANQSTAAPVAPVVAPATPVAKPVVTTVPVTPVVAAPAAPVQPVAPARPVAAAPVAPVQPVAPARPVAAAPAKPVAPTPTVTAKPSSKSNYYMRSEANDIKNKWIRKGLEARAKQNQNK